MQKINVQFCWLQAEAAEDLNVPEYETPGSAGMDIRAAVPADIVIQPGKIELIATGFGVAIPQGYEIQVRPRSGLAAKYGITLINSPGTIDSDYRGEVKVPLINLGDSSFTVRRGDRIAQMVVAPVIQTQLEIVGSLEATSRGAGGFGHTGI